MKDQGPRITKIIFKNHKGLALLKMKTDCKVRITKGVWCKPMCREIAQRSRTEDPEMTCVYAHTVSDEGALQISGGKHKLFHK